MNDASLRFAEGQTDETSLLSSEEGNLRSAELAQHAVELTAWVTEEGLRGATAGELFDGYCQRLSALDVVIMRAYVSTQTLHPNGLAKATHGDENSVRCVSSSLPGVQFRTSG
jgi:hypothetical protein